MWQSFWDTLYSLYTRHCLQQDYATLQQSVCKTYYLWEENGVFIKGCLKKVHNFSSNVSQSVSLVLWFFHYCARSAPLSAASKFSQKLTKCGPKNTLVRTKSLNVSTPHRWLIKTNLHFPLVWHDCSAHAWTKLVHSCCTSPTIYLETIY